MEYREYTPHEWLRPYIACYWTVRKNEGTGVETYRVFPDACSDIILNMGAELSVESVATGACRLRNEKFYLAGPMTTYLEGHAGAGTFLLGIRFRPFGIFSLLGVPLQGTADQQIELDRTDLPLSPQDFAGGNINESLDRFFMGRLNEKNRSLAAIAATIFNFKGNISVHKLSGLHYTTERQLERLFRERAGTTVKQVCNQVRFQHALRHIGAGKAKSFLEVAYDTGYFDHAHLLKHFKKYAGLPPSSFL